MLRPALLICVTMAAVLTGTATAAEPKATLDDLLKAYTDHGLPLPPKGAKLVKYDTGCATIDNNGDRLPDFFSLAFEIAPASKTRGAVLLIGTRVTDPGEYASEEIKPEPDSLTGLECTRSDDLISAIQCQSRGWDKLAAFLYERSQKEVEVTPAKQLRNIAWRFWESQITKPKIDRTPAYRRLTRVMSEDKEFDTKPNRALLHSLELALLPSDAKPGSIEAMIDALVDDPTDLGLGYFREGDLKAHDKLAALGFDAVPALLDHLDDDRLTRGMMLGFNNFRPWHLRVKDRVAELIEDLAAEKLERGPDTEDVDVGWRLKKTAAGKWWASAQKVGEEPYLLSKLWPPKDADDRINKHALLVLRNKYPKQIASLFKAELEKEPKRQIATLAESVAKSKLNDGEKLALLLPAAEHRDLKIRSEGLKHLASLDNKKFTAILLETLDHLPRDMGPDETYESNVQSWFVILAAESDDAGVWPVLGKMIARSSPGLKFQLLFYIADADSQRNRLRRLRLLAEYLDDKTIRDTKADKGSDEDSVRSTYPKIELRNFTAMWIARFFYDKQIEPSNKRTPEEWAKLREQVRAKLKQELGDTK